jgi:hypothetical protein
VLGLWSALILMSYFGSALMAGRDPFCSKHRKPAAHPAQKVDNHSTAAVAT